MLSKIKELDNKYETIIQNRMEFVKKNIPINEIKLLIKWGVFYTKYDRYCRASKEYIKYLCEKEGIPWNVKKTIKKRRKEKRIETKNPIVRNMEGSEFIMNKDLDDLKEASYWEDMYWDGSFKYKNIKELSYKKWQEFKQVILSMKKYFEPFIFEKQKKEICTLTDCYKEGIKTRICELCGNEVTEDAIYCSDCGKKIK